MKSRRIRILLASFLVLSIIGLGSMLSGERIASANPNNPNNPCLITVNPVSTTEVSVTNVGTDECTVGFQIFETYCFSSLQAPGAHQKLLFFNYVQGLDPKQTRKLHNDFNPNVHGVQEDVVGFPNPPPSNDPNLLLEVQPNPLNNGNQGKQNFYLEWAITLSAKCASNQSTWLTQPLQNSKYGIYNRIPIRVVNPAFAKQQQHSL